MAQFEHVLNRLLQDPDYRQAVAEDWSQLTNDYRDLDANELLLLMQVWHASSRPEAEDLIPIMMCHCCCCLTAD